MFYVKCPDCGAHLDPGESCDCHKVKMSQTQSTSRTGAAHRTPNINDCLNLKEIRQETGAMAKDVALVIREHFPKFNRQLLSQCEAWEKYGIIAHPDILSIICDTYGVTLPSLPSEVVITAVEPKKQPNRKLDRKLTFRLKSTDYQLLERRVKESGCRSSQEWLYEVVLKALWEGQS